MLLDVYFLEFDLKNAGNYNAVLMRQHINRSEMPKIMSRSDTLNQKNKNKLLIWFLHIFFIIQHPLSCHCIVGILESKRIKRIFSTILDFVQKPTFELVLGVSPNLSQTSAEMSSGD